MRQHFIVIFVIALPLLALAQPPSAEYQQTVSKAEAQFHRHPSNNTLVT
jgi:hypothetical protein